jgi:lantibiotic biosynthesis dehydratase-like protein
VLADRLSSAFPGSGDKCARMVAELVRLGFLITSLRPAMTATDASGHVTRELRAAGAHEIPEMAGLLEQLEALRRELAAHNAAEPEHQGVMCESLSAAVTEISAEGRTPLCLDLRLDAEVTLPEPVGYEMAAAASALIRLSPNPTGSPIWEDYHRRQRWITLYMKRWMAAPIAMPGGEVAERDRAMTPGSPKRGAGFRCLSAPGSGPCSAGRRQKGSRARRAR